MALLDRAVTVAKRENVSILPTFFGVILRFKNRRLATVRSSFWKKNYIFLRVQFPVRWVYCAMS